MYALSNKKTLVALAVTSALITGCDWFDGDDPQTTTEPPSCSWPQVLNDAEDACVEGRNLHVASPEWQDQIIYFVMPDRFADGDSSNNDQGASEYDPSSEAHYSGGDLVGVEQQLDYIEGLGATALWMTPIVANQWWDPVNNYGGYHGYWARNFMEVDEHYGTLDDYKNISHQLHQRGMYLIQDVIVNHVGNYMRYNGTYDADDTSANFELIAGNAPVSAPTQAPFNMNDRNNPEHVAADIYHWTPDISDYKDATQEKRYQLSGLDDLNTDNPVVRDALRQSYGYWISEAGVDAFRFDTAKYVEQDFWTNFLHTQGGDFPGIYQVAAQTGRDNFLTFGEVWETSLPMQTEGEEKLAPYTGTADQPGMDATIAFPLHMTIGRVFAEGQPTGYMGFRLQQYMSSNANPYVTPTFVDNHDTQRFLAKGSLDGFKQALTLIMTIPGIPVIYQGSEQALLESREAMFVGGYHNDDADRFDTESEMYQYIRSLISLRKGNPVLSRGDLTVLADNPAGPGVLAYKREYQGTTAVILINTAAETVLANRVATGLANGTHLNLLHGTNVELSEGLAVGHNGDLTLELAPNSAMVLLTDGSMDTPAPEVDSVTLSTDIEGNSYSENLAISGTAPANASLTLVIDGKLQNAIQFDADASGDWHSVLPIANFAPGDAPHTVTIYAADSGASTPTYNFTSTVQLHGSEVSIDDPLDDDYGYNASYITPANDSFDKQMDIEKVTMVAAGSTLKLTLTMQQLTDTWNPDNGFDHVGFSIFFDLPGHSGSTDLPLMHATAPADFHWSLGHVAFGWGNFMFNNEGADADTRGANISSAPEVSVDKDARTITFTYDGSALGLVDWEQAKVYISTWDIDGMSASYRNLTPSGSEWEFGGAAETDPRIMDDTEVLTVPVSGVTVTDDADDEAYTAPLNESFNKQMDILSANLKTSGTNLLLKLQMAEITDTWAPDNHFDHVGLTVFIDLPEQTGLTVLPRLNANTPAGMDWDVMSVSFGWGNAAYGTQGATADDWGQGVTPAPTITVDKATGTISLLYNAAVLGNPMDLSGTQVYITTWDIDGMSASYRPLSPDGAEWEFGGGAATDPKIMDSIQIAVP